MMPWSRNVFVARAAASMPFWPPPETLERADPQFAGNPEWHRAHPVVTGGVTTADGTEAPAAFCCRKLRALVHCAAAYTGTAQLGRLRWASVPVSDRDTLGGLTQFLTQFWFPSSATGS
jgi:hypothetical protein